MFIRDISYWHRHTDIHIQTHRYRHTHTDTHAHMKTHARLERPHTHISLDFYMKVEYLSPIPADLITLSMPLRLETPLLCSYFPLFLSLFCFSLSVVSCMWLQIQHEMSWNESGFWSCNSVKAEIQPLRPEWICLCFSLSRPSRCWLVCALSHSHTDTGESALVTGMSTERRENNEPST